MVPGREMADVAKTKQEFWNFLETINGLITSNAWPRIIPLECGSFFHGHYYHGMIQIMCR